MRQSGTPSYEADKELLRDLKASMPSGSLFEIKPYEDSDQSLRDAVEMFKAFHNVSKWNGINISPINSFEIWYDGDELRFFMYIQEDNDVKRSIRHIASNYPGAKITVPEEASKQTIPQINEGDFVSGARMKLSEHFFEPIRSPEGVEPYTSPYRNIMSDLVEEEDVREVIQVLFRPASSGWTSSFFNDAAEYADGIESQTSKPGYKEYTDEQSPDSQGPSELEDYANLIKRQMGRLGYYVNIRVLTVSENQELAESQIKDLANSYRQYYRSFGGQTFNPIIMRGSRIRELVSDMVHREGKNMDWPQNPLVHRKRKTRGYCETMIMTIQELAGVAHLPTKDELTSNAEAVDWERLDTTNRMPSKAPRYKEYKVAEEVRQKTKKSDKGAEENQGFNEKDGQQAD